MGSFRRLGSIVVAGAVLCVMACSSNDNNTTGNGSSSSASGAGSTASGEPHDSGGSTSSSSGGSADAGGFALTSTTFAAGSAIPAAQTCSGQTFGDGVSPEFSWTSGPSGTMSYAIVLKDLTVLAGSVPARAYHWTVWDIPASASTLPGMIASQQTVPNLSPAQQYRGGPFSSPYSYFGPCPAWMTACDSTIPAETDNYVFVLYALPAAVSAVPLLDAGEVSSGAVSYVQALDDYFQTVALASTELPFTSNAVPANLGPVTCPAPADASADDGGEEVLSDATTGDASSDAAAGDASHDAASSDGATADASHDAASADGASDATSE